MAMTNHPKFAGLSAAFLERTCIKALKSEGSQEVVIKIIKKANLSLEQISKILIAAAETGNIKVLSTILGDIRYTSISSETLVHAFVIASLNNHREVTSVLLKNEKFAPTPVNVSDIFSATVQSAEIFEDIIRDPRFAFTTTEILGRAFFAAATNNHMETFTKITQDSRFSEIDLNYLYGALRFAASMGIWVLLKLY